MWFRFNRLFPSDLLKSFSLVVWWCCLHALLSYPTRQLFAYFSFEFVFVWHGWQLQEYSAFQIICFSIPPPPPPPPRFLLSSSFLPSFVSFFSLASSAVCLPDCLESSWNIVHIGRYPCCTNSSFWKVSLKAVTAQFQINERKKEKEKEKEKEEEKRRKIACHNTVYYLGHGRLARSQGK